MPEKAPMALIALMILVIFGIIAAIVGIFSPHPEL